MLVGVTFTAVLQVVVIGIAMLQDGREAPIFPRWAGWLNIVVGATWIPGTFIVYAKHGPLAWNGLLSWWVPCASYLVWMAVMTVLLLKAVDREESEVLPGPTGPAAGRGVASSHHS